MLCIRNYGHDSWRISNILVYSVDFVTRILRYSEERISKSEEQQIYEITWEKLFNKSKRGRIKM